MIFVLLYLVVFWLGIIAMILSVVGAISVAFPIVLIIWLILLGLIVMAFIVVVKISIDKENQDNSNIIDAKDYFNRDDRA